jgi:hypothetical protein
MGPGDTGEGKVVECEIIIVIHWAYVFGSCIFSERKWGGNAFGVTYTI